MSLSLKKLFRRKKELLHVTNAKMQGKPVVVQKSVICGNGSVKFGRAVQLGWKLSPMLHTTAMYFEARNQDSLIQIGNDSIFNNGATIISVKAVTIGERCLFGTGFRCYDSDFHGLTIKERNNPDAIKSIAVEIGDDCWCGDGVTILKGVKLGRGCVVGAGSVVTKSFPDNSLIAGNPARLVRTITQE